MSDGCQTATVPELLAPAGDLTAGLVAFDAGADAVYAGLRRFNARERTENFSEEEMGKLIGYARTHGRKVYVTVNTLVKERELPEVADLLGRLAVLRPHAVIVQDLGVLRLVRDYFPELAIHASTQMGTHSSAAVNLLAERGVERVILQRQIPIPELAQITAASRAEVEVFVHGALCCCLSGSCLLSSWLGGWSGNRGRCKQPCRRRYFGADGNGFFLSTKDLYTLDLIPALRQLGVAGFKIEGRLRKADYVERAVRAYRMMLDTPSDDPATLAAARRILAGAGGRKWSHGFLEAGELSEVVQHDYLGVSGALCGRVTRTVDGGFSVRVSHGFAIGDRLRVQPPSGDEGPALVVTKLSFGRRPVRAAKRGEVCFVHYDRTVPRDGLVYRIGGPVPDLTQRMASLPAHVPVLDLAVEVGADGLTVRVTNRPGWPAWTYAVELPAAKTQGLEVGQVADAFRKEPSGRFCVARIEVTLADRRFLLAKRLRHARQAFWGWVAEQAAAAGGPGGGDGEHPGVQRFRTAFRQRVPPPPGTVRTRTTVCVRRGQRNPVRGASTARLLSAGEAKGDELVLPDFVPEPHLSELRQRIARAVSKGVRHFRATSLAGVALLRAHGEVTVTASFPLPVANTFALRELLELGVDRASAWVELDNESRGDLVAKAGPRLEVFVFGRLALLTTRARLPAAGDITDGRGEAFRILRDGILTRVYSSQPLRIDPPAGVSTYIDLLNARLNERPTSTFNEFREWA